MKQFKVGDRVAYNQKFGSREKGEEGVVTSVDANEGTIQLQHGTKSQFGSYTSSPYAYRVDLVPAKAPASKAPLPDAVFLVSQAADRIYPRRSYDTILKSLMEEVGELSTEIAIAQGTKKRAPSADGIKGEAVDVFVVAVDMLRNAFGDKLHTTEFTDYVQRKLNKWEGK